MELKLKVNKPGSHDLTWQDVRGKVVSDGEKAYLVIQVSHTDPLFFRLLRLYGRAASQCFSRLCRTSHPNIGQCRLDEQWLRHDQLSAQLSFTYLESNLFPEFDNLEFNLYA